MKVTAQGRTNIYDGMERAFNLTELFSPQSNYSCNEQGRSPFSKLPDNVLSLIFFLSDGRATSGLRTPGVLLNLFKQINYQKLSKPVPIYTIAFGADADVEFLKTLSSQNGGVSKIIAESSGAGEELARFYKEISSPVLSRIHTTVSINGSNITPFENYESPLLLIKGTEVITVGQIFPTMEQPVNRWSTSDLSSSTEAISKSGKLLYKSTVHDCQSLETTFDYCMDRIDLFLERLQAYNLLKKFLERDRIIREGYYCLKSVDDDFYSQNYEEYEYTSDEDDVTCVNPYKNKIVELAIKVSILHGLAK